MKTSTSSRELQRLADDFRDGSRRALSQLITWLQDGGDPDEVLAAIRHGGRRAIRVGLTGPAGVGKSTLAAAVIRHLRELDRSVAVVASDPASPLTGGALLGDRIRMQSAIDTSVFVRSLSTRGATGGVPDGTGAIATLLEQFGFEVVVVETIGVGQDQVAVRGMVDVLVLVVTPAGGDEIQWRKAGLLEVADIVVVNKADLPGADAAVAGLQRALDLKAIVLPAVAIADRGVPELWQAVQASYERCAREVHAAAR